MATETRSAGTHADDASVGTLTWSNPGNAASSNDVYATVSGGPMTVSHHLKSTNFGFTAIGDSDTLTQLKLRVERKKTSGGTIADKHVYLVIGGVIQTGTDYADTTTGYTSSDAYAEYTISSGLPTVAQLKATGFGFVIAVQDRTGASWGVDLDHTEVIANYTPAGTVVTPTTVALVLATFAPTIRLDKIVKPAALALVLATFPPTVISSSPVVIPSTAALLLAGQAPTIRLDKFARPSTLALATASFAPTIRTGPYTTPPTRALTLAGFAPTVLTPRVARPSTRALVLATFAPAFPVAREWQIQSITWHET